MEKFTNAYAVDGLCHNANAGTYGHECGKPAAWLGVNASGFAMGFCDHCKANGFEARAVVRWIALAADDDGDETCPGCGAVEGSPEWGTVGDGFDGYCPSCADARENRRTRASRARRC